MRLVVGSNIQRTIATRFVAFGKTEVMRTKEPRQYKQDFAEVSRRSIRKDFKNASFYKQGRQPRVRTQASSEQPESNVKRVLALSDTSGYARYKRFFIGKLVRILRPAISGGYYVEFVRDDDRKYLNANAGWDDKREYLLDGARYD